MTWLSPTHGFLLPGTSGSRTRDTRWGVGGEDNPGNETSTPNHRCDGATSYKFSVKVEVLIRGFPQSYRANLAFASPMSSKGSQEVPGVLR